MPYEKLQRNYIELCLYMDYEAYRRNILLANIFSEHQNTLSSDCVKCDECGANKTSLLLLKLPCPRHLMSNETNGCQVKSKGDVQVEHMPKNDD